MRKFTCLLVCNSVLCVPQGVFVYARWLFFEYKPVHYCQFSSALLQQRGTRIIESVYRYAGTLFPEMWICEPPSRDSDEEYEDSVDSNTRVVTVFVHNSSAEELSSMGEEQALKELVNLLDNVFGGTLASDSFVKGSMVDWSREPYIQGGYASLLPCVVLLCMCVYHHAGMVNKA